MLNSEYTTHDSFHRNLRSMGLRHNGADIFLMNVLRLSAKRDGTRRGVGPGRGDKRPCRALEKLEQWLVGFPCRVLIRCVPGVSLYP